MILMQTEKKTFSCQPINLADLCTSAIQTIATYQLLRGKYLHLCFSHMKGRAIWQSLSFSLSEFISYWAQCSFPPELFGSPGLHCLK